MLVHDYPAKSMSQDDIEHKAKALLSQWKVPKDDVVDILDVIENRAPKLTQTKGLVLVERPDGFMGERDAYAVSSPNRIFAKPSIIAGARQGDGRSRVILGHELSHIILHPGAEKAWMSEGNIKPNFIPQSESSEWQATALILAILVEESKGATCGSALEIAHRFKIDLEHAYIRYEILARRRKRDVPEIYYAVKRQLEDANGRGQSDQVGYMRECCPSCKKQTLIPIGTKFLCHTCNSVTDCFPDGDP